MSVDLANGLQGPKTSYYIFSNSLCILTFLQFTAFFHDNCPILLQLGRYFAVGFRLECEKTALYLI